MRAQSFARAALPKSDHGILWSGERHLQKMGRQEQERRNVIMSRVHKAIDIKAPVARVFSYVEDPRNATEWINSMVGVRDIRRGHYNWTWDMAGMEFDGESDLIEDIPNEKMVVTSKGGIESTWTFNFESHGNMTHLDLEIDYKMPASLSGKESEDLVQKQSEHETEIDLQNIKDRVERTD